MIERWVIKQNWKEILAHYKMKTLDLFNVLKSKFLKFIKGISSISCRYVIGRLYVEIGGNLKTSKLQLKAFRSNERWTRSSNFPKSTIRVKKTKQLGKTCIVNEDIHVHSHRRIDNHERSISSSGIWFRVIGSNEIFVGLQWFANDSQVSSVKHIVRKCVINI